MTECNEIIIASLESYMNGKKLNMDFDSETAEKLICMSRMQKILPIVFLKNSQALQKALTKEKYDEVKSEVMFSVFSQVQRNAELVRVCKLFKAEGINCIVFKGAVCRALYSDSEYRTSSDEDIFVAADSIERAGELLQSSGYKLTERKSGELKLVNPRVKSLLEVHSGLVDSRGSDGMKEIDRLFSAQLECPVRLKTEAGDIPTFSPDFGFLSLCVHFFNHFVRGGIGIRPVMDIACFVKNNYEEIDFDYCFSLLRKINAEGTILSVLSLCRKYFDVECAYQGEEKTVEKLLDDIMNAGAYGTSDSGRTHSGAVTKKIARSNRGFVSSAFSVLFQSDEEIVSAHPELKGKSDEIRKYRFRRIAGFAGEKGKIKTLATASKRNKLLKELGIID